MSPGDTIDRYSIEALLGEGGMGAVYRAHDMRLNRKVALKVLKVTEGKTAAAAARLLREARNVASFEHPNAVTIFDVGEVDGSPYIAMELINGKTLRDTIGAPIAFVQRILWLVDAGRALAAAHEIGLVHRDVKPENIMVRDDGCVKVLDFGIARKVQQPNADASGALPAAEGAARPKEGKKPSKPIVGSPLYMSSERLAGKPADGRSDEFSWGVSAFHILAGKSPWGEHRNAVELYAAIMFADPEPLREAVPEVPESVVKVIEKAMAKKPEDRFASMDEAVDAIEAAIGPVRRRSMPAFAEMAGAPSPERKSDAPAGPPLSTSTAVEKPQLPSPAPEAAARATRPVLVAALLAAVIALFAGLVLPRPAFLSSTPTPTPKAAASDGAAHTWLALRAYLRGEDASGQVDEALKQRSSMDREDVQLAETLAACLAGGPAVCEQATTSALQRSPSAASKAVLAAIAARARAGDAARAPGTHP